MNLFKPFLLLFVCWAAVECGTFSSSKIIECLNGLKPNTHLRHFLQEVSEYCELYFELKNATYPDKFVCEYASKLSKDHSSNEQANQTISNPNRSPVQPSRPTPIFIWKPESTPGSEPVYLNVYDLEKTHPIMQFLKCIYFHYKRLPLYTTTISFRGTEYFYGLRGISKAPDGQTSLGDSRTRMPLAYEALSTNEFEAALPVIAQEITPNEFVAENYRFLKFDSNTWTNETMLNLYGWPLPDYIEEAKPKFVRTQMGEAFSVFGQLYLHDHKEEAEIASMFTN